MGRIENEIGGTFSTLSGDFRTAKASSLFVFPNHHGPGVESLHIRPVQLWPPDPDRSLHKGVQGQAQVEPPPVARPPAKSSRPFPSGCDEREPQREKCLKSVGVAA